MRIVGAEMVLTYMHKMRGSRSIRLGFLPMSLDLPMDGDDLHSPPMLNVRLFSDAQVLLDLSFQITIPDGLSELDYLLDEAAKKQKRRIERG
jgi:hypothetical protein